MSEFVTSFAAGFVGATVGAPLLRWGLRRALGRELVCYDWRHWELREVAR